MAASPKVFVGVPVGLLNVRVVDYSDDVFVMLRGHDLDFPQDIPRRDLADQIDRKVSRDDFAVRRHQVELLHVQTGGLHDDIFKHFPNGHFLHNQDPHIKKLDCAKAVDLCTI